jgi:hypothetical protein
MARPGEGVRGFCLRAAVAGLGRAKGARTEQKGAMLAAWSGCRSG